MVPVVYTENLAQSMNNALPRQRPSLNVYAAEAETPGNLRIVQHQQSFATADLADEDDTSSPPRPPVSEPPSLSSQSQ